MPSVTGTCAVPSPAPCDWLAQSLVLVCETIPSRRGAPPAEATVPAGPNVQEAGGVVAPVRTYEDMLTSAHDDALFDYYLRGLADHQFIVAALRPQGFENLAVLLDRLGAGRRAA